MGKRCCGTCKFHHYADEEEDWVCGNPDSEYFSDFTAYGNGTDCWEYEEREPGSIF